MSGGWFKVKTGNYVRRIDDDEVVTVYWYDTEYSDTVGWKWVHDGEHRSEVYGTPEEAQEAAEDELDLPEISDLRIGKR
jgi:hypothetical protein